MICPFFHPASGVLTCNWFLLELIFSKIFLFFVYLTQSLIVMLHFCTHPQKFNLGSVFYAVHFVIKMTMRLQFLSSVPLIFW